MKFTEDRTTIDRYVHASGLGQILNDRLRASLRCLHVPAFSAVYQVDTRPSHLYLLVEGEVQCTYYHGNGTAAVISLLRPFSALGDLEILSDKRVNSHVVTTQSSTMLAIPAEAVQRFGAEDPPFLRFLLDQLRDKLYTANSLQIAQVLPVKGRLALFLLSQLPDEAGRPEDRNRLEDTGRRERIGNIEDATVHLPDKESLASLLATTHRHLNRVFGELVAAGAIGPEYPYVRLTNRRLLEELVER